MFGFIKKLFGGKAETQAECPYKVETPAPQDLADIAIAQRPAPTPVAQKATEAAVKSVAKPAKAKKPASPKPAAKKPAGAKKGPRKPKAKAQ